MTLRFTFVVIIRHANQTFLRRIKLHHLSSPFLSYFL